MTSVDELYALQEIDSALDSSRASLSDAQARLGDSAEVAEAGRLAEERRGAIRAAERAFKESESEADELRRKIEPLERRLYEGSVRNPKELEDLEADVASLKRRRSDLEDKAIAAMEALEQAQRAGDEAERRGQGLTDAWAAEQEELQGRQASLEEEIAELEERRGQQEARIDGALLRLYEQLRGSHGGRAVVKVEGGACGGCRISLPMNVLAHARAGNDVVQCTNCERILYVS